MQITVWNLPRQAGLGLAAAVMVYAASNALVTGADSAAEVKKEAPAAPAPKNDPKEAPKAASKEAPKTRAKPKKITGQELYAIHCNRCHPERYPTEFTSAQWKTIGTHMRVRANLPAAQAREIIKYLQEESGN